MKYKLYQLENSVRSSEVPAEDRNIILNRASKDACFVGDNDLQWIPERQPPVNTRNVESTVLIISVQVDHV